MADAGVKEKVTITLPDGSQRDFDGPVSGADLAASIGPRLAKDALAVVVDGALRDLARDIDQDAAVEIVTRGHPEALPLLRHDCAHVLAEAARIADDRGADFIDLNLGCPVEAATGRGFGAALQERPARVPQCQLPTDAVRLGKCYFPMRSPYICPLSPPIP